MIKDRVTQVLFRSIYVVLMFFAILDSLGAFNGKFPQTFYVFYTNQSNYICFIAMVVGLVLSINALVHKQKEGTDKRFTQFEFLAAVWILITCLVYNFLLVPTTPNIDYFGSFNNPLLHLFGPLLFLSDYFLFGERKCLHLYSPVYILTYPYLYIAFVLIRGAILTHIGAHTDVFYPYFFLDVNSIGYGMVFVWIILLSILFVGLGYFFWYLNNRPFQKKEEH